MENLLSPPLLFGLALGTQSSDDFEYFEYKKNNAEQSSLITSVGVAKFYREHYYNPKIPQHFLLMH